MCSLKDLFVIIMTALTVLAVFFLADVVLGGILYVISFALWNILVATKVYKWFVAVAMILQIILVILCSVKYVIQKGDK